MKITLLETLSEKFPFATDVIAIDATNALKSAEIGIRSFRARPLLGRIWEELIGKGQERISAIDADIITTQKATLELINILMSEESRTQYCVERVLKNLLEVNAELDNLSSQVSSLNNIIHEQLYLFSSELKHILRTEIANVTTTIKNINYLIQRERKMRHFTDLYKINELHPGTGKILSGSFYMSCVAFSFAKDPIETKKEEWKTGLRIAKSNIGNDKPIPISDFIFSTIDEIEESSLETTAYLLSKRGGPITSTLNMLVEHRLSDIKVDEKIVNSSIKIARRLYGPKNILRPELVQPSQAVEQIAKELLEANV